VTLAVFSRASEKPTVRFQTMRLVFAGRNANAPFGCLAPGRVGHLTQEHLYQTDIDMGLDCGGYRANEKERRMIDTSIVPAMETSLLAVQATKVMVMPSLALVESRKQRGRLFQW
jgi:hypothetical protein